MDAAGFPLWFTIFSHDSLHIPPTIRFRQLFKKTPSIRLTVLSCPISGGKKRQSTNPQSLLLLLYYKYQYQQRYPYTLCSRLQNRIGTCGSGTCLLAFCRTVLMIQSALEAGSPMTERQLT